MANVYKVLTLIAAIVLPLTSTGQSIEAESALQQWRMALNTPHESSVLSNILLTTNIPGSFPHEIRERFTEISQVSDAIELLEILVDPSAKGMHLTASTLLATLKNPEVVELYENYFFITHDKETRKALFGLIARTNSVLAFESSCRILIALADSGDEDFVLELLNYLVLFDHSDVKVEALALLQNDSSAIRAASYMTLRNHTDAEVLYSLEDALVTEELRYKAWKESRANESTIQFIPSPGALKQIAKLSKLEVEQSLSSAYFNQTTKSGETRERDFLALNSPSQDTFLAEKYAPQLKLSGPGTTGVFLSDSEYSFADYIPISVDDLTSLAPDRTILFELAEDVTFGGTRYPSGRYPIPKSAMNLLGSSEISSPTNSLIFDAIWENDVSISTGYRTLDHTPTVYYKVFRNPDEVNPVAIQFWFFYFYNQWMYTHPGDWESITIFLDSKEQPVEVAYFSNYEATRASWKNVNLHNQTHPVVYVSNGGHGSYLNPGVTSYHSILEEGVQVDDNHLGDKEILDPSDGYELVDLAELETIETSWLQFEGRWGNNGTNPIETEFPAPNGPRFIKDSPDALLRNKANHPPFNPYNNCSARLGGVNLYGSDAYYGPWFWASGYGLDTPWTNGDECVSIPVPSSPTNLSYLVRDNQITIFWDPSDNGTAVGYVFYYTDSSGTYSTSPYSQSGADVGNLNQYTVEIEDGNYKFAIEAYDIVGRASSSSTSLFVTVDIDSELPQTPLVTRTGKPISSGLPINGTTAILEWDPISGVSGYEFELYDVTSESQVTQQSSYFSSTYAARELEYGHTYRWRVRACNTLGCGDFTPYYYFTIVVPVPSAPTRPYATAIDNEVTVTWTPSSDASGYIIYYGTESGNYQGTFDIGNLNSVSEVAGAGIYYLAIGAYNSLQGHSELSREIVIQVPATEAIPSTPTTISPGSEDPPGPLFSDIGPTLNWQAVPAADYYNVDLRDTDSNELIFEAYRITKSSYDTPLLVKDSSYTWAVQACNSAGCSSYSNNTYFRVR